MAKHNKHSNAGRPQKLNKELWGQITCVLRHDTIARLREGAGSRFFGEFLQDHLDRYPPPAREQYEELRRRAIPIPRVRRPDPWDDRTLPPEERFQAWADHAAKKHAYEQAERRANLAAYGLSEKEIKMRLNPPSMNDVPRKTRARRTVAHQKR